MNIWFFVWLLVATTLLGFLAWTIVLHVRQVLGWRRFAQTHGLRFSWKGWMNPPEVHGMFRGYKISLFTGEHGANDPRASRKRTAIEIILPVTFPNSFAAASMGMSEIVKAVGFSAEIAADHIPAQLQPVFAGDDAEFLHAYFSPQRQEALLSLMKIRHVWTIFIARGQTVLLRIDTPFALDSNELLEKYLTRMIAVANVMSPHDQEMSSGAMGALPAPAAGET